jgi:anaerobic selenocysteine-containing dehydrogenase
VNIEALRDVAGKPWVEIHPTDAAERGITSGQTVRLVNDRGSYSLTATVRESVPQGTVAGFGLRWGANINAVTPTALTDYGAGATFFDCLVEVEKV